jgi:2'-5' RNA ligase
MKRLFIGIRITRSESLLALLSGLRLELKNERIRWTDVSNLHITLAFLGDTGEEKIREIAKAVDDSTSLLAPFTISLQGVGVFRSIKDPRVIWIGSGHGGDIESLRNSVVKVLADRGLFYDPGRFRAHVTLGRMKNIIDRRMLKVIIEKYRDYIVHDQDVMEVVLFESILGPGGPVYHELSVSKLGKN